jgi:uncharacterized membrane protein YedE/YeeE
MKSLLTSLIAGLLFGFGLAVSGMTNPAKVLGFLTFNEHWDASLAFVMGGALMVTVPAFHFILQRQSPLWQSSFSLPTRKDIDPSLILGAILFGLGWAIAGLCPGPAIANLAIASPELLIFIAAMLAGFYLAGRLSRPAKS